MLNFISWKSRARVGIIKGLGTGIETLSPWLLIKNKEWARCVNKNMRVSAISTNLKSKAQLHNTAPPANTLITPKTSHNSSTPHPWGVNTGLTYHHHTAKYGSNRELFYIFNFILYIHTLNFQFASRMNYKFIARSHINYH